MGQCPFRHVAKHPSHGGSIIKDKQGQGTWKAHPHLANRMSVSIYVTGPSSMCPYQTETPTLQRAEWPQCVPSHCPGHSSPVCSSIRDLLGSHLPWGLMSYGTQEASASVFWGISRENPSGQQELPGSCLARVCGDCPLGIPSASCLEAL